MRIGLIQMAPFYGEGSITRRTVDANLEKSCELIDRAAQRGPAALCFPGFSFSGPVSLIEHLDDVADTIPGRITDCLGEKARQHGLYVATNLLEKGKEGYFNAAVLIGPEGRLLLRYRKVHLYPTERFLASGREFPVCKTPLGGVGLLVCYDLAFPEAAGFLAARGAKIIFCPTMALDRTLA
ncbi:MAG: carbon-nitrogen hydrolase family protein, partial [Deltaproteobacteria bacterium]|nr:carbon-nitrogen hydrolase family protein [Deltaproteobacteria bacterium]